MSNNLPLLAIETSGELCSVAVFKDENKFSEVKLKLKNVHSQMLVPMIDQALKNIKLEASEIKVVALSIGPGSFTGLRIGLATAKGFAAGINAELCPVEVFDATAFKISQYLQGETEFGIVIDANISDVYLASFRKTETGVEKIEEVKIVSKKELNGLGNSSRPIFQNVPLFEFASTVENLSAYDVGIWALRFGKEKTISEFDFLEPEYFQQFVPKMKKKTKQNL